MKCPRCTAEKASKIASAPDGSGAWDIFYCTNCNFGWRSTEGPEVIVAELRDPWFQLEPEGLEKLPVVIPLQR